MSVFGGRGSGGGGGARAAAHTAAAGERGGGGGVRGGARRPSGGAGRRSAAADGGGSGGGRRGAAGRLGATASARRRWSRSRRPADRPRKLPACLSRPRRRWRKARTAVERGAALAAPRAPAANGTSLLVESKGAFPGPRAARALRARVRLAARFAGRAACSWKVRGRVRRRRAFERQRPCGARGVHRGEEGGAGGGEDGERLKRLVTVRKCLAEARVDLAGNRTLARRTRR